MYPPPLASRSLPDLRWPMVGLLLLRGVLSLPAAAVAAPESMPLGESSLLQFATVAEGAAVLGAEDEYTRRTSPFDRQARLRTNRAVSEAEHRAFAGRCVIAWEESERAAVAAALAGIDTRMNELGVSLPPRVLLVKTSGDEEGGAAYTRGMAVMLPKKMLAIPATALRRLLCHELFHVLSRSRPDLRDALYDAIGFSPCGDVRLPGDLEDRRITNPDAPSSGHAIAVEVDGVSRTVVPVLYSKTMNYDSDSGAPFFATMEFRLMAVRLAGDPPRACALTTNDGAPMLFSPESVTGFYEQVGRNTGYIIHPEEILADNFVLLVLREAAQANPEIVARVGEIIRAHSGVVGPKAR